MSLSGEARPTTRVIEPDPAAIAFPNSPASPPGPNSLGFERLHALLRGGYVPQVGAGTIDSSIVLEHKGKGPKLRIFPDGRIQVMDKAFPIHTVPGRDPFSILAGDDRSFGTFARFLESVPKGRRRRFLRKTVFLMMLAGFWGLSVMLLAAITGM